MADDDAEEEEEAPAVELGDREPVEGQPLARVASRLTWPKEASRVLDKEGDSTVRTPDGPKALSTVLDSVDETYFESRQEFMREVGAVVGDGPVATEE